MLQARVGLPQQFLDGLTFHVGALESYGNRTMKTLGASGDQPPGLCSSLPKELQVEA